MSARRTALIVSALVTLAACGGDDGPTFHEAELRDYLVENAGPNATAALMDEVVEDVRHACTDADYRRTALAVDVHLAAMVAIACPEEVGQ